MDCFASLAMTMPQDGGAKPYPSMLPVCRWVWLRSTHPTNLEYDSALSRRDAPEVLQENLALENRGRGEDRVRAAPAVSQAKLCIKHAHEHTGSAENTPAFPAQ